MILHNSSFINKDSSAVGIILHSQLEIDKRTSRARGRGINPIRRDTESL